MRKAQIFTIDFIIAFIVFSLLLVSALLMWDKTARKTQEDIYANEMAHISERTAKMLISTRGQPITWEQNPDDVKAVGLADGLGHLSQAKIDALTQLGDPDTGDMEEFRGLTGAGNYRIYVRITNATGHLKGEAGEIPTGDVIVNTRRISSMGTQSVFVDVSIWVDDFITYISTYS